jgi:hypothetical protein
MKNDMTILLFKDSVSAANVTHQKRCEDITSSHCMKVIYVAKNIYFIAATSHVKWVSCHHDNVRPQVADRADGLQIWRVAANILNKQLQTTDSGGTPAWGVGWGG